MTARNCSGLRPEPPNASISWLMIEAFGGKGYRATTPAEVTAALTEALAAGGPALIDCVIDPSAGTESGNIGHLNPKGLGNFTAKK